MAVFIVTDVVIVTVPRMAALNPVIVVNVVVVSMVDVDVLVSVVVIEVIVSYPSLVLHPVLEFWWSTPSPL